MAKQTELYLTDTLINKGVKILPADTTDAVTLYTAGTDDAVVKSLSAVSDDTSAVNLRVLLTVATVDYQIGTVNVPIASGTDGTAATVDVLAALEFLPLDRLDKPFLPLEAGTILKVAALATITADKTVTVTAAIEEY